MIVGGVTLQSPGAVPTGRQDPAVGSGNPSPPAPELSAARQRVQQHVQAFIAEHDQEAHFSVDRTTGMTIVQIVNRSSGELVRQIPTEEVVRIAQFLDAQGALVNAKA